MEIMIRRNAMVRTDGSGIRAPNITTTSVLQAIVRSRTPPAATVYTDTHTNASEIPQGRVCHCRERFQCFEWLRLIGRFLHTSAMAIRHCMSATEVTCSSAAFDCHDPETPGLNRRLNFDTTVCPHGACTTTLCCIRISLSFRILFHLWAMCAHFLPVCTHIFFTTLYACVYTYLPSQDMRQRGWQRRALPMHGCQWMGSRQCSIGSV